VAFLILLSGPLQAERLRISPDDLQLRVAVSEELPASIRREINDLAKSVPLPVSDGLLQSQQLFEQEYSDRGWSDRRLLLVRYYFLVSRLEQSQAFSDEFLRRELLLKKGIVITDEYINKLNPLIARGPYNDAPKIEVETVQDFPLHTAERLDDGGIEVLKRYPAPTVRFGVHNLKSLRADAEKDRSLLKKRLEDLQKAERTFLKEISQVGHELIRMRPQVRRMVSIPGEGLPFSP